MLVVFVIVFGGLGRLVGWVTWGVVVCLRLVCGFRRFNSVVIMLFF